MQIAELCGPVFLGSLNTQKKDAARSTSPSRIAAHSCKENPRKS
jgi:hypothetical protein